MAKECISGKVSHGQSLIEHTHLKKKKKKTKQESQEVQAEKVRQKSGDRTRGFQEQRHSGRVE